MDIDYARRTAMAMIAGAAAFPGVAFTAPMIAGTASFDDWLRVVACVQRYADAVDRNDAVALANVFTADAVYHYSPIQVMNGRAAITAGIGAATLHVAHSSHLLGPPSVTATHRRGPLTVTTSVVATHQTRDGGCHTVFGRYHDTLRDCPDGRMRILRRQLIANLGIGEVGDQYRLDHVASPGRSE